jgi:hypothetical protein
MASVSGSGLTDIERVMRFGVDGEDMKEKDSEVNS